MSGLLLNVGVLAAYVAISTAGLITLKAEEYVFSWRWFFGLAMYALGFIMWLVLLRRLPVSIAFPLAASLLMVSSKFAGIFILGEKAALSGFVGMAFILVGSFLVYLEVTPE